MKRFLKKDRYELSLREQEDVWRGIQRRSGLNGNPQRSWWRGGLPVFGMTTAVAAVLMVAVWLNDREAPMLIAEQVQNRAPAPVQVMKPDQELKSEPSPQSPLTVDDESRPLKGTEEMREAFGRLQETKELDFQTVPVDQPDATPTKGAPRPVRGEGTKSSGKQDIVKSGAGSSRETPAVQAPPPPPPAVAPQQRRYSLGSTEEALQKQSGGLMGRAPRRSTRGENEFQIVDSSSGDLKLSMDRVAATPMPGTMSDEMNRARRLAQEAWQGQPGSVTGGTTPPNGEQFELMYFEHAGVNPFVTTEDDALSTFAVDVDNASYTVVRNYLNRDALPPRDAVRVEEFVNFFGGGYPAQGRDVFAIHTDGSASPFGQGYHLLRVGLQGMDIDDAGRKPATLIFVIDISGSMSRENRLGTVKKSLRILLDQLGEGDRVGIVTYGSQGHILLEPADLSRREEILRAIEQLAPGGSTNAADGLELAYDLARKHLDPRGLNRLILCSDGVANMGGTTRAEEMLVRVKHSSAEGITLSTVGFGLGNYNDVLMEKLANQGDGNYHYVDSLDEARRVFKENLTGLLQTIARQVKIQVEFDPERVQRWRLLGYENRDVADRDFRNDKVDAGEVGAGHQVTALYELKLEDGVDDRDRLGTVRVRYQYPAHDRKRADKVEEMDHPITAESVLGKFAAAPAAGRLQAVAAEFAEILRGSYWARESSLADLAKVAGAVADDLPRGTETREKAEELIRLIRKADQLQQDRLNREKALDAPDE